MSITQIRLCIYIPQAYYQEPILFRLVSEHNLLVNITGAKLSAKTEGKLDIELRGTPKQIKSGLTYLETLDLKIIGKPNSHGDGWYY